jgi:hypothetical protein
MGRVLGVLLVVGCDVNQALLNPQNPGVIDPGSVNSPAAAEGLRVGAFGQLKNVTGGSASIWLPAGLLVDEWKSADVTLNNDIDQRSMQTNNGGVQAAYNSLQQSRGYARTAIDKLTQFSPDSSRNIGQMYFTLAFEEMMLADDFCNGVPMTYTVNGVPAYGPPLTNVAIYSIALAHADSALLRTSATDALTTDMHRAALIGKARVLVDQGSYAAAAALVPVSAVPTNFQYLLTFDQTSGDNQFWSLNVNIPRYVVSDSADVAGVIGNALPFASSKDPRVPAIAPAKATGFDGVTPLVTQQIWKNRNDPVPLVSGIDARLIEAEAALNANDFAGMMTMLNALRTTSQTIGTYVVGAMPALTATPVTLSAAVTLFFREKAFWTFGRGQRLPDARRLVRQYGRPPDQVYPTGIFFKGQGGVYGNDVNFPVPDGELTNPNFKACIDRKA